MITGRDSILLNQFERKLARDGDTLTGGLILLFIARKKFERAFLKAIEGFLKHATNIND